MITYRPSKSSKTYTSFGSSSSSKKKKKYVDFTSDDTNDTGMENINKQTVNYKTRLEAIKADGKDTRNPVEKLLNLPEDQNFLFDIGEILDRPFNAIKGGIQEAQEGGNFLEGLGSGISGEKTYYSGDILRNAGVSDDALFTNPLNGEDVSAADILGLGLDMFADPTTLIPAGGLVKGVNVASAAGDVAKATKTLNKATEALDVLKAADTALDTASDAEKAYKAIKLTKAADKVSDAEKALSAAKNSESLVKNMATPNMSLMDAVTAGIGGGIKKLAGITDTGITKGLEALDDKTLKTLVKKGASADIINNVASKADLYKNIKKGIGRTVDFSKSLPNDLISKVKGTEASLEGAKAKAIYNYQDLTNKMNDYVSKSKNFKNIDELDTAIEELIAANKNKGTDIGKVLKDAVASNSKNYKVTGTTESVEKAVKALENNERFANSGIKILSEDLGNGESTLKFVSSKKNKSVLSNLANNQNVQDALKDVKINKASKLTVEQSKLLDSYKSLYKNDKDFKNIFDEANNFMTKYGDDLKEATGGKVDYNVVTSNPGYFRKSLEDSQYAYKPKAYGTGKKGKYTDYSVWEANNINEQNRLNTISSIDKNMQIKNRQMTDIKRSKVAEELSDVNEELANRQRIAANVSKLKENRLPENELANMTQSTDRIEKQLGKAKLSYNSTNEAIKKKNIAIDDYKPIANQEMLDKLNEVRDTKVADSYVSAVSKYNDDIKSLNNLSKKLDSATSETEISNIMKQINKKSDSLVKTRNKYNIARANLDGAMTKKIKTNLDRAINDTSNLTKTKSALLTKQAEQSKKIDTLAQANSDLIENLKIKKNNLELKYENLDPSLPANKALDEKRVNEIKKLNEQRTYLESQEGKQLFKTSFLAGLEDNIKLAPDVVNDVAKYNNVLLEAGMNDDNIVKFLGKDNITKKIPYGYKRVSKEEANKLVGYLDSYKNLLPDSSKDLLDTFKNNLKESKGMLIDEAAYDLLGLNKDINNKTVKLFADTVNSINNTFKKYSTFSVGFQVRNLTGNMSNQWLSGIPLRSLASEYNHADKLLKGDNMWKLLNKATDSTQVLTKAEKADVQLIKDFVNSGFLGQGSKVRDLEEILNKVENTTKYKSKAKKVIDNIFKANVKGNEWIDAHARLASLSYARKHPEYVAKLGVKSPIEAVKYTLFDPSNLSGWEKNVAKKAIPFYTFTKQNLMFHASNILKNSSKYKNLVKAFDETYDSLGDDQYYKYQKEGMNIPIYTDENGNTTVLKANLPASDFGEWISDPLRRLVSSSNPIVKVPFEAVTGIDTFTGAENNKKPTDYLASMIGLTNASKVPGRLKDISTDNTAGQNLSDIFGSVFTYNDAQKIANSNDYQEYLDYQNYINELKKKGIAIPTIQELKKQGIDIDAIREQVIQNESALRKLKRKRNDILKSFGG